MGKISILTKEQKIILDEVGDNPRLSKVFYFTGGTALSEFYLKHRESVDLDFFSVNKFDPQIVYESVVEWSNKYNFTFKSRFADPLNIYNLRFPGKPDLKVDFGHYPYRQMEKPTIFHKNLAVDSLLDIAINKISTITQRSEAKDFVDLYFLLKKFTFWDLREGLAKKFHNDLDPFLFSYHFMAIEDFTNLPKMYKPLTLSQLQQFFRKFALKLGKTAVV